MTWHFRSAREEFSRYQSIWDGLNRARGNHPLLDSMFVGALIRHFGSQETLMGIEDDDNNPGMVILEKPRRGFWQTFQPSQGPLGLFLLANDEGIDRQIANLIRSLPGYALGL